MVTETALMVTQYCAVVIAGALCARILGRSYLRVRQASTRVLVVFLVFLMASAYVWIELGPEVDQGFARLEQPLIMPTPRYFDI